MNSICKFLRGPVDLQKFGFPKPGYIIENKLTSPTSHSQAGKVYYKYICDN